MSEDVTARQNTDDQPKSSVVEGETTPLVRIVRLATGASLVGAVIAGAIRAATTTTPGRTALVAGILLTEVILAAILILLGSLVEGLGFGLSLGTHWPYTRNIFVLALQGDPEAAHRLTATLVGLLAVVLVFLSPNSATISGLSLIIATALFGVGTLHVLAGRLPSFVHGIHGLLAYGVLLCYLSVLAGHGTGLWTYVGETPALHAVLLAAFLGGMTTGQRGFGTPIGAFYVPVRLSQWVMIVHLVSALAVVGTLGWLMPEYPAAFYLAVGQILIGFLLFHAVNLKPKSPGILVAFHQTMALAVTIAIVAVPS